jgi:hypothetical protein
MFVVYTRDTILPRTNDTIRRDKKLDCEQNTRKGRDSHLFHTRKLDMETPPDSLEVGGVNDLLVVVTFDESFTTEQARVLCLGSS